VYSLNEDKKLTCKNDYKKVFAGRKAIYGRYFQIIYHKHQTSNNSARLGLAIAKKHHKLAVQRNRLKRITREAFRTSLLQGFDIIVLSKHLKNNNKTNTNISNENLFTDLKILFGKLK
jgi:ribonuclease P protein component